MPRESAVESFIFSTTRCLSFLMARLNKDVWALANTSLSDETHLCPSCLFLGDGFCWKRWWLGPVIYQVKLSFISASSPSNTPIVFITLTDCIFCAVCLRDMSYSGSPFTDTSWSPGQSEPSSWAGVRWNTCHENKDGRIKTEKEGSGRERVGTLWRYKND